MLGKNFSTEQVEILLSYFSQKRGFNISCNLSLGDRFCLKCLNLFSGKKKEIIIVISLLSIEYNCSESGKGYKCDVFIVPRLFEEKWRDTVFGFPWGVVRGAWCVARGAWRVARGAWCVVPSF